MRLLFVTWDGPGTRYLQALFFPILDGLRRHGVEPHVLQFAWEDEERSAANAQAAETLGIPYTVHPVWRRPVGPATLAMMGWGGVSVARYVRRHAIDTVIVRSLIPAGMGLIARRLARFRFVFDADGLMADERVEFGGWSETGASYRLLRTVERAALRRADRVLVRTRRAVPILRERVETSELEEKTFIVSNGRDETRFAVLAPGERMVVRRELGVADSAPLLVYAGSIGPQYHVSEMLELLRLVRERRPDAHLLGLVPDPELVRQEAQRLRLPLEAIHAQLVAPDRVPRYLGASDVGLALRTPSLSQRAVAPIKVGEYLLCGVPVASSAGIGDLDDLDRSGAVHLIPELSNSQISLAAAWVVEEAIPERERLQVEARALGEAHFGLSKSVAQYAAALA